MVVTRSYNPQGNTCGKPRKKDKLMAKNMTRKGLALGAAFALAGTGLVAAPAQAAVGRGEHGDVAVQAHHRHRAVTDRRARGDVVIHLHRPQAVAVLLRPPLRI